MFLTILTFDYDFISGSCLTFWGPKGLFLGFRKGSKTVLRSTQVVVSFSMIPSILSVEFDVILGLLLTFWAIFMVREGFKNCFWVYSCS